MFWCQHSFIDSPEVAELFAHHRAEGFGIYWRILQHIGISLDLRREGVRPAQTLTAQGWGQICGCTAGRFLEVATFAANLSLICMTDAGHLQHGRRKRAASASQLYEINAPILLEMLGSVSKKAPEKRPTLD